MGSLVPSSDYFDQADNTCRNRQADRVLLAGRPLRKLGNGGFYDTLNPNNRVLEDVSYAKLREVAVNFRVGRIAGVGDWTLGVIGRNLYTFSRYTDSIRR